MQVENCDLLKDFSDLSIGDRDLVRQYIGEGWSGARCSLENFAVKCVDLIFKW